MADAKRKSEQTISDANRSAENTKKDKMLEAKEHFLQLKAKHDAETVERNKKIVDKENQLKRPRTIPSVSSVDATAAVLGSVSHGG